MIPERITISDLPECSGLNESSAINYFRAKHSSLPLIKNRIIDPFEELLENKTGFSNDNLPEKQTVTSITFGEIIFTVDSATRKKRPQLEAVYQGVKNFLELLEEGYQKNIKRKGVKTIDGKSYVLLEEILSKIFELNQEVTMPEVKHSHGHNYTKEYDGIPIVVPLSQPIALNENGGLLYVKSKSLSDKLENKTIKPFEKMLKEQTGYNSENVPTEMDTCWIQIGSQLFEIRSIPESTVKYAQIINELIKPAPEKINARSKIGELIRIKEGLLEQHIIDYYMPRTNKGGTYIIIEGTLNRLKQLKEQNTHETLNQPIRYYPVV